MRLGAFEPQSTVAGPGERVVVWVTGCLRRCPGCMKPEWFAFDTGDATGVDELLERVLAVHAAKPLAGVTFSGGEPFEQAEPLGALAGRLRRAGLDVLVYSGYRLAALCENARFAPLLEQTDWLIDGEYDATRPGPVLWRGSDNQTVYHRGPAGFAPATLPTNPTREVQVSLTGDGLRLTGFPDARLQRQLQARLDARGIRLTECER